MPSVTTDLDAGCKDTIRDIIKNIKQFVEELPIEEAVEFYQDVVAAIEKMPCGKTIEEINFLLLKFFKNLEAQLCCEIRPKLRKTRNLRTRTFLMKA